MAIGTSTIKTSGRVVFSLQRTNDTEVERTTRSIDIAYPITDTESLQSAVNTADSVFTDASNQMNVFIQPANWRDNNQTEEQWTTTGVYYEAITTTTTPVMPDEPDTLGAAQSDQQG